MTEAEASCGQDQLWSELQGPHACHYNGSAIFDHQCQCFNGSQLIFCNKRLFLVVGSDGMCVLSKTEVQEA